MTLSVPSPLHRAGNTTSYCYVPPKGFPTICQLIPSYTGAEQSINPSVRAVLRVCLLYLSRISELLSLTTRDVVQPDRVICSGLKRSRDYLIFLPGLSEQIALWPCDRQILSLFSVTYMQCYRACVSAGIRHSKSSGKNTPRTHAGRFMFTKEHGHQLKETTLRDILHHNSISSQSYYL